MDNPFDLNLASWTADEVTELRKSARRSFLELSDSVYPVVPYPTIDEMSARIGVHPNTWGAWESKGVRGAWAALLCMYRDEDKDITPAEGSMDELNALVGLVGSWSALARALGTSRTTLGMWRFGYGKVPAHTGYGRLVRICCEDMLGRLDLPGGLAITHDLALQDGVIVWDDRRATYARLGRLDVVAQAAVFYTEARTRNRTTHTGAITLRRGGGHRSVDSLVALALHGARRVTMKSACTEIEVKPGLRMKIGVSRDGLRWPHE